jgi:hypothetical protein
MGVEMIAEALKSLSSQAGEVTLKHDELDPFGKWYVCVNVDGRYVSGCNDDLGEAISEITDKLQEVKKAA